jgi:DDE superfamily endonuclease
MPKPLTRPSWPTRIDRDAPYSWARMPRACCSVCLAAHPKILATRTRAGPYRCCRSRSSARQGCGPPTTPSAVSCTNWTTPGSDRATPCSPIRSCGGKKRRIRRQIKELPRRSVLLAEDETDLLLFPPLRAGWSAVGQAKQVMLCGGNARRVVFGAMNLRTGYRLFLPRERQRAADFQAFLRVLHDRYRGWQVALLLDEDSSHTALGSVRLADWLDIELLWLPKRAPQLNPLDTLWGQGKDIISASKQYGSIEEQVDRFLTFLKSLSNQEALHTSGVLSPNFWLKRVLSKNFCGSA